MLLVAGIIVALVVVLLIRVSRHPFPESILASDLERQGREVFRDDTFGDEQFWTDSARLHDVVDEEIQPIEALRLGLKVDVDRLNLLQFVLHNPLGTSGTRELLRQNAVVGLRASIGSDGHIERIGITCALCHSTVDNALLPGIGHRLDGWPNRSLQVGKILAMLPIFTAEQKEILGTWPKGTYDPRFNFDGQSTPLVLPPAYGLANVENETYTAEGPISYWNAYVAVTQMHGHGSFTDPRLGVNIVQVPDEVTPKLAALRRLPAQPSRADSVYVRLRQRCGGTRKTRLRNELRAMPCEREPDGQQRRGAACPFGDRHGSRVCGADLSEDVPDYAASGTMEACAVLPRRQRGDARRCGRALHESSEPSAHGGGARRSRRVLEVVVIKPALPVSAARA